MSRHTFKLTRLACRIWSFFFSISHRCSACSFIGIGTTSGDCECVLCKLSKLQFALYLSEFATFPTSISCSHARLPSSPGITELRRRLWGFGIRKSNWWLMKSYCEDKKLAACYFFPSIQKVPAMLCAAVAQQRAQKQESIGNFWVPCRHLHFDWNREAKKKKRNRFSTDHRTNFQATFHTPRAMCNQVHSDLKRACRQGKKKWVPIAARAMMFFCISTATSGRAIVLNLMALSFCFKTVGRYRFQIKKEHTQTHTHTHTHSQNEHIFWPFDSEASDPKAKIIRNAWIEKNRIRFAALFCQVMKLEKSWSCGQENCIIA